MSMSGKYEQVLVSCRLSLVKDLDPEDVMDHLITEGVFTLDDQEAVKSKSTRKAQVRLLLEILRRRGNKAFEVFVKALKDSDSGHHHLYEFVEKKIAEVEQLGVPVQHDREQDGAPPCSSLPGPVECTEQNPHDRADGCKVGSSLPHQSQHRGFDYAERLHNEPKSPNMRPDDKLLSTLAGKLGQEWEQLATFLGLSSSDIYRCKVENQFNMWGQSYASLIKWRNREYKNATVQKLVDGLRKCGVGRDNYEFLMNA